MNIENYGTTYAKETYTSKVTHSNGPMDVSSTSQINLNAPETIVNGDLSVKGKLKFTTFASESLEGDALTVQGDSILQGSMDLKGTFDVSSLSNLKEGVTVNNGDIHLESNNSLLDTSSSNFFVMGNGDGSWRIGVLDNKLSFQRCIKGQWVTINQMGQ